MSVERDIRVPWWSKLTHILAVSSTFVGTRYRGFTTSPALDPLGSSQSSPPPNPQLHLTHLLRVQKPSTFVFPCLPFFFCFFVWTCEASSDWICHRYFLVRAAELNTSQLVEMKNGQVHPLYNIQAILQDGFRFFFFFFFFCFLPISLITSHPDRIYTLSIIYETLEVSMLSRVWSGVYLVLVLVPHFIQSSSIPNEKKFCMWCKSNLKTFLPLDDATTWVKLFLTVDATCGSILLSSSRSELFDCELLLTRKLFDCLFWCKLFDCSFWHTVLLHWRFINHQKQYPHKSMVTSGWETFKIGVVDSLCLLNIPKIIPFVRIHVDIVS